MKTLKSKLVKLLIAVCACAICITAVPAATQNVHAATKKTYVLSKSQEKKALKLVNIRLIKSTKPAMVTISVFLLDVGIMQVIS